jgi:hypothetical protein
VGEKKKIIKQEMGFLKSEILASISLFASLWMKDCAV